MKNITIIICLILLGQISFAQKSDGTVRSLINTEEYFNVKVKKDGLKKAFLDVINPACIVFRPKATLAQTFYENQKDNLIYLSWKPELAIISKSGDFGFTSGPFIVKNDDNNTYGHYISVWKADKKRNWKLVLDGGVTHPKPNQEPTLSYNDPSNYKYPKLLGPQKIKWREDIVFNTDVLLGKSLSKSGNNALDEFYDTKMRLYFPNQLPKIGKEAALKFIDDQNLAINTTPTFANRAISGDLAYTYGSATVGSKNYSYIRIWQIDQEMKWNIIIDAYLTL